MFSLSTRRTVLRHLFTGLAAIVVTAGAVGARPANAQSGAVFTSTNATPNNAVVMFERSKTGELTTSAYYFTGGSGTGAGLGSQGAVALSSDNRWLFVVNAGSNDVSIFATSNKGLRLVNRFASGGTRPVSVTYRNGLLYVLNAGAPNNVTGFWVNKDATVTPIPGSTQPLSGADTSPAQVSIDPFGGLLVVTERATQNIDVYPLNPSGVAGPPVVSKSVGVTPFGFGFDAAGRLFVSEAFGGANGASAISSYFVSTFGILPISASVPTTQTAACWVTVGRNNNFVYTGNAGNANNVSGFGIAKNGLLSGLGVVASGLTGTTDITTSPSGKLLFALENRAGSVRSFSVNNDGTLNLIGSFGNLGAGFAGIAAY